MKLTETISHSARALSEAQVEAYVADGGVECPYCQSEELEASNQVFTEAGIYFDCSCLSCLNGWKEHYVLASIFPMDDDDNRVPDTSN